MKTPDKWTRKAFDEELTGLTVRGKVIHVSDTRIPINSDAYILQTTTDKSHDQETKCNKVWNIQHTLDIVTIYQGNSGSRVLCDDIEEAVLNIFENIQIEHFKIYDKSYEFAPNLSSQDSTQTIFRKIIIFNIKLKQNG